MNNNDTLVQLPLPSLERLANFFFEGSLRGYAGGGRFLDVENPYPEKVFYYGSSDGMLIYKDTYRRNGEFSSGETVIYAVTYPNISRCYTALWSMSYHGWCRGRGKARFIDYLKEKLRQAYESRVFFCGRGMSDKLPSDGLLYTNVSETVLDGCNTFEMFNGRESILDNGEEAFWHRFGGLLMVPRGMLAQQ